MRICGRGAPSSAPVCALGHLSLSPLPLRDIIPTSFGLWPFPPDRGNRPLDKGSRPPGGRLRKNKKGQVFDLSLKTQRRNAVSHKISLPTFFFKESRTGRWRGGRADPPGAPSAQRRRPGRCSGRYRPAPPPAPEGRRPPYGRTPGCSSCRWGRTR